MKKRLSFKLMAINLLSFVMTLPLITFADVKIVEAPNVLASDAVITSNVKEKIIREMKVHITAYSSTVDQTDDTPFITASGTYVRDGIVAANFLPIGTKIKIPEIYGDKVFVVEDRMNERYKNTIDVWHPNRESAKEFGHKISTIQIIETGEN